jgi:hypothetical protein
LIEAAFRPGATAAVAASAASARLLPARVVPGAAADSPAPDAAATPAPLRRSASSIGATLQDEVARAQQALDYLERVAGQLETLKSSLSARLSGRARPQLDAQARELAHSLAARKRDGGGGVDANLDFSGQPAVQRFRIRGLDLARLQENAPQNLAFSVGGIGGPQLSATITPEQSEEQAARAIDRALAPLGVRAGLDGNGGLEFSTPETDWPAVKDSIAISGRGRVIADEAASTLAPQQWNSGKADALRQSLREVVQALARVRRSQDAVGNALASAGAEVARAQTPPPQVEIAAGEFAAAAAGTDYAALLSLSSALVGVSRERVLALLGLR